MVERKEREGSMACGSYFILLIFLWLVVSCYVDVASANTTVNTVMEAIFLGLSSWESR